MIALAAAVVERLAARGLTLATAEASVGGLIGHLITDVPGASRVFVGGIAPYGRDVKVDLLHVDGDMLTAEGSVSEPAAQALARGVREVLRADLGLAETGVMSPTGNPERPAGMVVVALAAADQQRTERHQFTGTREDIKRQAAEAALQLVLAYLDDTDTDVSM